MSSQKLATVFGFLFKLESSYNAGGSVAAATDGVLLAEPVRMPLGYVFDGDRGQAPKGQGRMKRAAPTTRIIGDGVTLPIMGRGAGAAYAAGVKPPDIHDLLRASGHTATLDATASAEKYDYAPEAWEGGVLPAYASGVAEAYDMGEKYALQGMYAGMGWEVDDGGFLRFTFPIVGFAPASTLITDAAVPDITYNETTEPIKAESVSITFGDFTAGKLRRAQFSMERTLSPRGTHGWAPGFRAPSLELTIEATEIPSGAPHTATKLNPYRLQELGTALALSIPIGTVQYNRFKFTGATWQITDVQQDADGAVALWRLTMTPAQSDHNTADDYLLTFD